MWSRKDLKVKGKAAFKANYWKSVLVALLLTILVGGASGGFSMPSSFTNSTATTTTIEDSEDTSFSNSSDNGIIINSEEKDDGSISVSVTNENGDNIDTEVVTSEDIEKLSAGAIAAIVIVAGIAILVIIAIAVAVDIFLINPIELGCSRFFLKNTEEPAGLANIVYAFEHGYKNIAKILFYRDLYIILWSLLFIIPGIIKAYEYRMLPYILSENPEMTEEAAFKLSKEMMTGNKWKAFVLDLSFIGWELLSILTCGVLSIFYVDPYRYATNAELYVALKK